MGDRSIVFAVQTGQSSKKKVSKKSSPPIGI